MKGYQLWAYFEESATLYGIETAQYRRPDSDEVAEATDWRIRRMEIKPRAKEGQLVGDLFGSPEEAAKQVILELAGKFDSTAIRNIEFRLVETGDEGVKFAPTIQYKAE